jgi:sulfur carrier protein
MTVVVNGRSREVTAGTTVADLVTQLRGVRGDSGIAVALNGEVVARSGWPDARLAQDDRVEVLGAVGGG